MILIADSGSTKTTWSFIDKDRVLTCHTGGINPYFLTAKEIVQLLKNEFTLTCRINFIHFYGAGCTPERQSIVTDALTAYFKAETVEVKSDLWAAARSLCEENEGIVCILGTGSNSCYYDGLTIIKNIPSLGYILGDEGSGAALGKQLIADILKFQLPASIIQDFQSTYHLSMESIVDSVYCRPFPNRFLAQFTPFIFKHIHETEIQKLVEKKLGEFIVRNVLQYEKAALLPVHFTGSIAFYFKDNLHNVLNKHGLRQGNITKEPLPNLIEYYKKQLKYD